MPAGVLVTRAGARVAVGELPARLAVDDGSAPGVVLLTGDDGGWDGVALVARDAGTGDELWRAEAAGANPCSSTASCTSRRATTCVARDARTGEVRWPVPVGAAPAYLGTDGSLVVVVTPDRTLPRSTSPTVGSPASTDVGRLRPRSGRHRPGRRVRRPAARPVP